MHLDLLQSLSLSGDPATANDDRAGVGDRLAWVIDGATDLGPSGLVGARGGAAWLATEADAAFAAAPRDATLGEVMTAVFHTLACRFAACATRAPVARWELPIAAFLAVRIEGDALAAAWLGDCVGWIARGDRVTRIGGAIEPRRAEGATAARLGAGPGPRSPEVLAALRAGRGRPDHPVLGVEPEVAGEVRTARLPCAPGDELLLATDGFAALVDVYEEFDAAALVATLRRERLDALGGRLRAIEAGDARCRQWPRFKVSDDATALWLRVAG